MTGIQIQGNKTRITGYLTSFGAQSGGGFSQFSSPVKVAAIVK